MTFPEHVQSMYVDVDGPVHYLDFGGPAGDATTTVVAVHGLGGASWNWTAIAPLLTDRVRLLAVDLAGHGRTPPVDGRRATVKANRRLLDRFIREVVGEPVVLMGNSMGGAISLMQAATSPDVVSGLVLVDPALPRPVLSPIDPRVAATFTAMSLPGVGEAVLRRRRRRRTPAQQVNDTLLLCCVDITRVPVDVVTLGVSLTEERFATNNDPGELLDAARSLVRMLTFPRTFRREMDAIRVPVLFLHGDHDRLVSIKAAQAIADAHPSWRFEIARGIGHVPQLEAPDWTASLVLDWLDNAHSVASSSTR